jgi:XTP/dITP diphosphohydrolase
MAENKLRVVLATTNPGKQEEIRALLAGGPLEILTAPDLPPVEESGATYAENATRKALSAAAHTGSWALADDSGLEVDALGGRPGVESARFSGPGATDASNRAKLLKELRGRPPAYRKARFVCVMALAGPDGTVRLAEGECPGRIGTEERGAGGFGYDPLFLLLELGKTMAELGAAEKNRVSHRAKAAEKLLRIVRVL